MRKKQPMTTEESAWYSGMLVSVFVAVFTISRTSFEYSLSDTSLPFLSLTEKS